MKINQLGKVAEASMKCNETASGEPCPVHGLKECPSYSMKSESKAPVQEGHMVTMNINDDHEVSMAQGDLYQMAKKAIALHQMLDSMNQLEGWVQSKITLASDYINRVYDYLDHEMAMAGNVDGLGESIMPTGATVSSKTLPPQAKSMVQKIKTGVNKNTHSVMTDKDGNVSVVAKKDIAKAAKQGSMEITDSVTNERTAMNPQLQKYIDSYPDEVSDDLESLKTKTEQEVGGSRNHWAIGELPDGRYVASLIGTIKKWGLPVAAQATFEAAEPKAQYKSLNDVYPEGSTEIWYWKEDFARDAMMGPGFLAKRGLMPTPDTIKDNYALIGKIAETRPEKIFMMMQGDMWSPEGQARNMIRASGTGHTSMSVGDIIKIGNEYHMVDRFGFHKLGDEPVEEMSFKDAGATLGGTIGTAGGFALTKKKSGAVAGNAVGAAVGAAAGKWLDKKLGNTDKEDDKKDMKEAPVDAPETDGKDNIVYQMRKVINLRGQYDVPFADGTKAKVPVDLAHKVLQAFNNLRMPADKLKFTRDAGKNMKALQAAVSESNELMSRFNKVMGEDWGSSDTTAAINYMKDVIRQTHGGKYNPDTIEDAAMAAAEFYHDSMGYDDPADAAQSLVGHFVRRWMSGSLKAD